MIELAAGVFALVAVLLVGAPLLRFFDRRDAWRDRASIKERHVAAAFSGPPAFAPLEIPPFSLGWPSETPWPKASNIVKLPWPSQTWDDEYFGQQAKKDVARIEEVAEAIEQNRILRRREGAKLHEGVRTQEQRDHQRRQRDREQRQRESQRRSTSAVEASRSAQGGPTATSPEEQFFAEPSRAPEAPSAPEPVLGGDLVSSVDLSPERIVRLVQDKGLSGAVEQIRSETDMDFRTAAQHLADVLRKHK